MLGVISVSGGLAEAQGPRGGEHFILYPIML